VLCEGGPRLNASLLQAGLVDELFLSISPSIAGGTDELRIVHGVELSPPVAFELVSVLESESHLFLRYRVSAR
jgi:riboflavin biosynthesis pyrimidine reductase